MKILLDGRLISNKPTGISRYSIEIIKIYQERYGKSNVFVLVNDILTNNDFNYIKTSSKPFSIKDFIFLHRILARIDFDIYHTLFYVNSFFKLKEKKYITTVHDLMYYIVGNFFGDYKILSTLKKYYFHFLVKRSLLNSDKIISVSETTKNDVFNIFGYNSYIIPEGINLLEGYDDSILKKHNITPNNYFFYVGNSRPHKNLDFLCETFISSNTNSSLVLCGNSKGLKKINNSKIIYLDYVSDEELSALYKNCKAFIFPSTYEGFGLPILEALNNGAKVISSSAGALKEFSKSAIMYFDPYNKAELCNLIETIDEINIDYDEIKKILDFYTWVNAKEYTNKYLDQWISESKKNERKD